MNPTQTFNIFPITCQADKHVLKKVVEEIKTVVENSPPEEAINIIRKEMKNRYEVKVLTASSSAGKMFLHLHRCISSKNKEPFDIRLCVQVTNSRSLQNQSLAKIKMAVKTKEDVQTLPLPRKMKESLNKHWIL